MKQLAGGKRRENNCFPRTLMFEMSYKNKAIDSFTKLLIAVTGMIAHRHGDLRYAHYRLDIYLSNSNHTIGYIS
jgi:hypothetical protein